MTKKILAVFLLFFLPHLAWADGQWVLAKSTLTFHVSHPLHEAEGVSHAAKGQGICHAGECNFLIAVPVNSFDSGNSNRDLHMLQIVRGAAFPLVVVRLRLRESDLTASTLHANLEIRFAGLTAHYENVLFQRTGKGNESEVTGTIPLRLSDFHIKPPELLAIPIKDEVPVRVDATWRSM
jgi:YceI-like domain